MKYNSSLKKWLEEKWEADAAKNLEDMRSELVEKLEDERERRRDAEAAAKAAEAQTSTYQPVIMGSTVYVMMPVPGADADKFREFAEGGGSRLLNEPIEISPEDVTVENVEDSGSPDPR